MLNLEVLTNRKWVNKLNDYLRKLDVSQVVINLEGNINNVKQAVQESYSWLVSIPQSPFLSHPWLYRINNGPLYGIL